MDMGGQSCVRMHVHLCVNGSSDLSSEGGQQVNDQSGMLQTGRRGGEDGWVVGQACTTAGAEVCVGVCTEARQGSLQLWMFWEYVFFCQAKGHGWARYLFDSSRGNVFCAPDRGAGCVQQRKSGCKVSAITAEGL